MRRFGLSLAVVASLALPGCGRADWGLNARSSFSETRELAKDGRFELENTNGRVEITAWDETKVSIEGTKRARSERALDELRIEISGEKDGVRVQTRYRKALWTLGAGRVDYVVRVPRGARVRVESVNGRVEITGITGEVAASTVNGTLELHDLAGPVDASTVNGTAEVALARVDPSSRNHISTTNGTVRLTLPSDASAEIDARTTNGGIACDFDLADETRSRRRLEGRIGSGGARFELRTVNGAVNIDRGLSSRAAERQPAEAAPAAAESR
jgi:putative adhesin